MLFGNFNSQGMLGLDSDVARMLYVTVVSVRAGADGRAASKSINMRPLGFILYSTQLLGYAAIGEMKDWFSRRLIDIAH